MEVFLDHFPTVSREQAVAALAVPSNGLVDLMPLIAAVEAALSAIQAGDVVEIRA